MNTRSTRQFFSRFALLGLCAALSACAGSGPTKAQPADLCEAPQNSAENYVLGAGDQVQPSLASFAYF
ncbi:MAG: hypothetical protein AAF385_16895 [Pseudomonadota bacterium]